MFNEELEMLDRKGGISDELRIEVNQRIAARAETDPSATERVLPDFDLKDLDGSHRYTLVIEALALESSGLLPLIEREYRRVRASCETDDDKVQLSALGGFEFLEQSDEYRSQALSLHVDGLESRSEGVRLAAVRMLHGWTVAEHPEALARLEKCLTDPSWRVRKEAEWLLADEEQLPDGYRTPLKDHLLRRFLPADL